MSNYPGIGVMVGILGGNKDTAESCKAALGKKIKSISVDEDRALITFQSGATLRLRDDGQSCCEHRYMRTDDDLDGYDGATLVNLEIADAPSLPDEYVGEHEVQFLRIITDKGTVTCANHNEHNGYYGGFWIVAHWTEPREAQP